MFRVRQLLIVCFVLLLAGCASVPPEIALDSKVNSAQNAGLVVGSFIQGGPYGTWMNFRNVDTDKSYGWGAKDYYSVWLPAGEYEVTQLGARRGVMGPYSAPLRFTVKTGVINYLGELVYDCPSYPAPTALYGVMNCGFLALGKCTVPHANSGICIVDREEQALRSFLKSNPTYSNMSTRSSLMTGAREEVRALLGAGVQ